MMRSTSAAGPAPVPAPVPAEEQIAAFLAKFTPEMQQLITSLRTELRKLLPTASELVYDNYNFLVFGFCSAPRASDCIASLTANSKGCGLSFYYGATLPDPEHLLQGEGSQNRFIRLPSPATLSEPAVRALIAAAIAQAKVPLPATGSSETIVKSISAKQRPRR